METFFYDVRYAFRQFRRSPGVTAVVIATAALGIGANTAIFSIVNALLLRPLPVERPHELVDIYTTDPKGVPASSSYPDFLDVRGSADILSGAAAYGAAMFSLAGSGGQTKILYGEFVSAEYFSVLGIRAMRGRTFEADGGDRPSGPALVAVISPGLWHTHFGGDPDVVGRTILLNGRSVHVIGIAPKSFKGMIVGLAADVWLPLFAARQLMPQSGTLDDRATRSLSLKGRLAPGVTAEQARARLEVLGKQLEEAYPATNRGRGITALPTSDVRFHPLVDRSLLPVATLLMILPALVLLIACTNIANLLIARATAREREIAIRVAMGAARARLTRQLLTESTLLSLAGGGIGVIVVVMLMRAVATFEPPVPLPVALDLPLDGRVLAFTLVLSILAGLFFGLLPARHASRLAIVPALRQEAGMARPDGARRRYRTRDILIIAQIATSLVLLVGAGLFVRSLQHAQDVDPGFETDRVIIVSPGLWFTNVSDAEARGILERLASRVAALPGIASVTLASRIPLGMQIRAESIFLENVNVGEADAPEADVAIVDRGYFQTLGVPLLRGRDVSRSDTAASPRVAIVSDAMARTFWPGRDPLAQRFRLTRNEGPFLQVVGVARDTKVRTLGEEPRSYVYLPYAQHDDRGMSVVARTVGEPVGLAAEVRREVQAVDSIVPILELKTMRQHLALMLLPPRLGARVLGLFGLVGLAVAMIGLYGVVAFSVVQRTREIGIRLAIGGRPAAIVMLIVREGMRRVAVGLVAGLALALLASRPLAAFLYGVQPSDPVAFAAVAVILVVVALIATYVPARRATRADPIAALRHD